MTRLTRCSGALGSEERTGARQKYFRILQSQTPNTYKCTHLLPCHAPSFPSHHFARAVHHHARSQNTYFGHICFSGLPTYTHTNIYNNILHFVYMWHAAAVLLYHQTIAAQYEREFQQARAREVMSNSIHSKHKSNVVLVAVLVKSAFCLCAEHEEAPKRTQRGCMRRHSTCHMD